MNSDRRRFLTSATTLGAGIFAGNLFAEGNPNTMETPDSQGRFRYCLNTSTIRGQELGIVEEVRIAGEAGYDGIEPWMGSINTYVEGGGKLSDLKKQIEDAGLTVDSAIGFAQWIVDDPEQRKAGLEEAKRDMNTLREIGGTRIAAPPAGATNGSKLDLFVVAERYRTLLELGASIGVIPQLEVWGFSTNLSRLGETVFVCVEADHPSACVLPDVYHIYKGGSGFGGLELLSATAIQVFHVNDYPAEPGRQDINDSHRVYPGDGIAPLKEILTMVGGTEGARTNRPVTLSLELFNREYWKQNAMDVARTGLAKMKAAVAGLSG
ncbi:MAG: sugar phosphate isomerase/epimerase [Planctomyces sp.]|nr:sugar phosphate isomerase/epimerase [Planctomyces sp.]